MKKLFLKMGIVILFVLAFLIVLEIGSLCPKTSGFINRLTQSEEYVSEGSGYDSVNPKIERVRADDGTTVLVIGDSVANQFFGSLDSEYPEVCVITSYAAINITGQYMLAMEWLNNHEDATDVYLIMLPTSMARTFDTYWTYPHGVIPFALNDMLVYLDDETMDQMGSVFGKVFLKKPVVRLIQDSAFNRKMYLNYLDLYREDYVQGNSFEITEKYLLKLKFECEMRGVEFHLLASPAGNGQIEEHKQLHEEFAQTHLEEIFPGYFDSIYYFPGDMTSDGQHLSPEYATRETMDGIIKEAYADGDIPFVGVFKQE